LLLVNFIKKICTYIQYTKLVLHVKHTPKFLNELVSILLETKHVHNNPLTPQNNIINNITFSRIVFLKNKHYGNVKMRKKGTVKRKVLRKVVKNNSVTD